MLRQLGFNPYTLRNANGAKSITFDKVPFNKSRSKIKEPDQYYYNGTQALITAFKSTFEKLKVATLDYLFECCDSELTIGKTVASPFQIACVESVQTFFLTNPLERTRIYCMHDAEKNIYIVYSLDNTLYDTVYLHFLFADHNFNTEADVNNLVDKWILTLPRPSIIYLDATQLNKLIFKKFDPSLVERKQLDSQISSGFDWRIILPKE